VAQARRVKPRGPGARRTLAAVAELRLLLFWHRLRGKGGIAEGVAQALGLAVAALSGRLRRWPVSEPVLALALRYLALEAERLAVDPVVLAAGSLVVAGSTVVHGVTSSPARVLYRHTRKATDSAAA
jgi:hypothetical protein